MRTGEAMNVLVTGAAGFLGQRLIQELLARGGLRGGDGARPIERLVAFDAVAPPGLADARVRCVQGDHVMNAEPLPKAFGHFLP